MTKTAKNANVDKVDNGGIGNVIHVSTTGGTGSWGKLIDECNKINGGDEDVKWYAFDTHSKLFESLYDGDGNKYADNYASRLVIRHGLKKCVGTVESTGKRVVGLMKMSAWNEQRGNE
jgi:hypothetical protein